MAKKNLARLMLELGSDFKVLVPIELKETFENDLKRGQLCMSVDNVVDSMEFNRSIYPDQVKNGTFVFEAAQDNYWKVIVNGAVSAELDPKYDKELIDALSGGKSLPVVLKYVSDSDCNWYHVDGDEDKSIEIGIAKLG